MIDRATLSLVEVSCDVVAIAYQLTSIGIDRETRASKETMEFELARASHDDDVDCFCFKVVCAYLLRFGNLPY